MRSFKSTLCIAVVATFMAPMTVLAASDEPVPRAPPEQVGMSSERLARIGTVLKADVEQGLTPGAVIAVARRGKLVMLDAYGFRDKAAGVAMTTDTIFNIASMTKPMTTVGALMLYEQGRLLMDDKLSKYFPKFATTRVAVRDAQGAPTVETVSASREITIQDLPRHTSGLIYGGRGTTLVHKMYPEGSVAIANGAGGAEFLDRLASLPLLHQPGAVWDYGFGLDVLGLVIEKISGQGLGKYLEANLWTPLGMKDTSFTLPADKIARYARPLPNDPTTGQPQKLGPNLSQPLSIECGGGCAASTATDYMRFALMLMHGGQNGETRVLSRKTVEYMLSDQLGPKVTNLIGNADPTRADFGFGLGLAVKPTAGITRLMGSPGSFSWPGASGTDWWADPKEDLVVVFLSAAPGPIRWHYRQKINALVYAALND